MGATHEAAAQSEANTNYRVAVLIPCHNEELTVGDVIAGFQGTLSSAVIYVYDNNSKDRTADIASKAGAMVGFKSLQGKGNVIRRMFADIDADIYVLVDGDNTYDASSVQLLISHLIEDRLDMVVATRIASDRSAYRRGHWFSNRVFTTFVTSVFGRKVTDMLSGYRVFTRRFVKSFPVLSTGFEIETELTVHALELAMPIGEVATPYRARPKGSKSKLNTWRDGFRIMWTIIRLYKFERPFYFFGTIGLVLAIAAFGLAVPIFETYFAGRHSATTSYSSAVDRHDGIGIPFCGLWFYSRYGNAGTSRGEDACLFAST